MNLGFGERHKDSGMFHVTLDPEGPGSNPAPPETAGEETLGLLWKVQTINAVDKRDSASFA